MFARFLFRYLVAICVLPIGSAQATIYFIDQNSPAASDANSGTEVAPWASFGPAMRANLAPGDMVIVRAGVYKAPAGTKTPQALIQPNSSGQSGQPIRFKSSPAFAATLKGDQDMPAVIQISKQNHIAIEGFKIVNPGQYGILVEGDKDQPLEDISLRSNIILQEQRTCGK